MDVSEILSKHSASQKSITVEKEVPLEIDAGFLTVTDLNHIDHESYNEDLETYLQTTARDGIQSLLNSLFTLPTHPSPDGPIAQLPAPVTDLPRAKPLPKPKPLTKWQKFAKEKGISHSKKDKAVWDEEKQEWVSRWGWKGKNKELETQWLTEVPANADVDHDPSKIARDARKARVSKNEKQKAQNIARAQGESSGGPSREQRKTDISRTLATTRASTASMGKFDRKLEGEKKLKGVKRKFEPAEASVEREKQNNLALLSKLDGAPKQKKARKDGDGGDGVLNVRKAVRFASQGKGSIALAKRASGSDKGKKSFKGKR